MDRYGRVVGSIDTWTKISFVVCVQVHPESIVMEESESSAAIGRSLEVAFRKYGYKAGKSTFRVIVWRFVTRKSFCEPGWPQTFRLNTAMKSYIAPPAPAVLSYTSLSLSRSLHLFFLLFLFILISPAVVTLCYSTSGIELPILSCRRKCSL